MDSPQSANIRISINCEFTFFTKSSKLSQDLMSNLSFATLLYTPPLKTYMLIKS
jgi:hypothetical protein